MERFLNMCRAGAAAVLLIAGVHGASAQYPNVRVNNPASTSPEEVTIAINPANPLNLIAGANIDYVYYSTDGGWTWVQSSLHSAYGVWGDPSLAFDAAGNAYYGHLSNPPSPGYWIDRIVVQKSTDGGQSWSSGAPIGFNPPRKNQDKEWPAVDVTGSPYHGNVYIAWTEFDSYGSSSAPDSSRILVSRSTDGGATFSSPVRVSDRGGNCVDSDSTVEGAVPAIGPGGEVYLSWAGPWGIMFDKSTDGGVTWGSDVYVADQAGGWDYNISGIYRANGMPVTACDRSSSPYHGSIYVQWSDQRHGSLGTDIFFARSTDGGATWGSTIQVNDDTSHRQHFFSWMTVDQTTGSIYVVFYDRRATTGDATDVYVARSTDGGSTWKNFKVSQSAFTPNSGVFFGDYTNIAAQGGMAYPIWMRLDGGTLSVWTAIIDDRPARTFSVRADWNMISLPAAPKDPRASALFPSASSAYGYSAGYVIADTLVPGRGYWLKFAAAETVTVKGDTLASDTVAVEARWNMVGAPSRAVPASGVASDPAGLITGGFYRYEAGAYSAADTLRPGEGYWIKVNAPGRLIFSVASGPPSARLRIIRDGEVPPGPPSESFASRTGPRDYGLGQNYPNPFNPSTAIVYQVPVESYITVKVFNLLGQEVAGLVDGVKRPGVYVVEWKDFSGPSGVYYYRMSARDVASGGLDAFVQTRKMIVVR